MKTKQLIKEVKSMGFDVKELHYNLAIYDDNEFSLAHVSKKEFGVLITDFPCFYRLDYNSKIRLLNLLSKYAKTPVEDREEEEKFKLKQKGVSGKYLIWIPELDRFTTGSSPFSNVEGIFTQSEIDDMPECYTHPAVWEKIKVDREWSEMD